MESATYNYRRYYGNDECRKNIVGLLEDSRKVWYDHLKGYSEQNGPTDIKLDRNWQKEERGKHRDEHGVQDPLQRKMPG